MFISEGKLIVTSYDSNFNGKYHIYEKVGDNWIMSREFQLENEAASSFSSISSMDGKRAIFGAWGANSFAGAAYFGMIIP